MWYGIIKGRVGASMYVPPTSIVNNPPGLNYEPLNALLARCWLPPDPMPPMPQRTAAVIRPPIDVPRLGFNRNRRLVQDYTISMWQASLYQAPAQGQRYVPQRFQIISSIANPASIAIVQGVTLNVPLTTINGKPPITWTKKGGSSWTTVVTDGTNAAHAGGTPGSGDVGGWSIVVEGVDANGTIDQWP